jgi:uncharacterized protein YfaP (DUF2135 family)
MNTLHRRLWLLCAGSALLALVSCGGGDGIRVDPGPLTSGQPSPSDVFPSGNVVGTAVVATNATAVPGATISVGATSTTSLVNGRWGLTLPDTLRSVASVRATGHVENFRVFAVAGLPVNMQSPLVPVAEAASVVVATGATVTQSGGTAQIVVPGNALIPATGSTATTVNVRITEVNFQLNLDVVPGDFTALDATNAVVPVETFGVVAISAADAAGVRYSLATGQTANVRIPAVSRGVTPPNSLLLMYFDETTGRWMPSGRTVTLNSGVYEGTVDKLGLWAAAQAQPTVALSGCVRDPADQPVANARVVLTGTDYNATAVVLTSADGTFRMPVRINGVATVTAQAGGAVTNTVAITSTQSATDFALTPCLRTSGAVSGMSIKLSWGAQPLDLDSHLFLPNGDHVYYVDSGSLTAAPFAGLDVDDVTSFGPEVVTVTKLYPGTYRYAIYNFSGSFNPGMTGSPAKVELTRAGFTTSYAPPAGEGNNRWWVVFDAVVDSACRVTIRNVQQWQSATPTVALTSSTPCN